MTAIKPKSSQNGNSQTAKNHKKLKKKVTETHPQSGPVKRLSLVGAKPLKLTTLTTLSAVFPKAQSSQSKAKMEAKMKSSGTQNHEKSKTRAPQKAPTKKNDEKLDRVSILVPFFTVFSRRLGALFEPWAALGPNWSPSLPREHPGWSQTLFSMIFDNLWAQFWLLFAFAHLSAITFFAVFFWIPFWLIFEFPHLSATTKIKSTVAGYARSAPG